MSLDGSGEKIVVHVDIDLEELIPGFLENRQTDIKSIQDAIESGDFETVKILGHSMKGSGGGYGFDGITDIGAVIEQAGKDNDAETAKKGINDLASYLDNVEIVYDE